MSVSGTTQGIRPGVCLSTNRPASPFTGQVIYMSDTDETAVWDGTAWEGLNRSRDRNVIINGAMQIHQRGTSASSITTSGYRTADRWFIAPSSLGTWTNTVENDAPAGSGFRKSLKILCTTADASPAAGDEMNVHQRIEGQNLQHFFKGTSSAKEFTVSFWVKSNVTGTYICELYDADNGRQCSKSYTISASETWEKKTITFPADAAGPFDNDNALSLYLVFWNAAGSTYTSGTLNMSWASNNNANRVVGQVNLAAATNNYWQITGVQLEAGSVATPFEFENYGETLRKCQRYYQTSYNIDAAIGSFTPGFWLAMTNGVDTASLSVPYFQVKMRATPTLTVYHAVGGGAGAVYRTTDAASITVSSINHVGAQGGGYIYLTTSAQNGYLYHYVAAIEL